MNFRSPDSDLLHIKFHPIDAPDVCFKLYSSTPCIYKISWSCKSSSVGVSIISNNTSKGFPNTGSYLVPSYTLLSPFANRENNAGVTTNGVNKLPKT